MRKAKRKKKDRTDEDDEFEGLVYSREEIENEQCAICGDVIPSGTKSRLCAECQAKKDES